MAVSGLTTGMYVQLAGGQEKAWLTAYIHNYRDRLRLDECAKA